MNVVINNILTKYDDTGQGKVILLLHGWGTDSKTFSPLAKELARSFRVVRLDFPGFGGSQMPDKPWGVADYAEFLMVFLNKVDIQPDIVLGHSFGGRIAIKALFKHNLTAKKLVLLASAGVKPAQTAKLKALKLTAKVGKFSSKVLPKRVQSNLRHKLYEVAGSTDYKEAGPLKETFKKVINEDLTKDAEHINLPTQLIWGANDDTTPVSDAKVLKSKIKNSKLAVVPNAGHFVYLDKPSEVLRLITNFAK